MPLETTTLTAPVDGGRRGESESSTLPAMAGNANVINNEKRHQIALNGY